MLAMALVCGCLVVLAACVAWGNHRELPAGADPDTREMWRRSRNIEVGALVAAFVFLCFALWELHNYMVLRETLRMIESLRPR